MPRFVLNERDEADDDPEEASSSEDEQDEERDVAHDIDAASDSGSDFDADTVSQGEAEDPLQGRPGVPQGPTPGRTASGSKVKLSISLKKQTSSQEVCHVRPPSFSLPRGSAGLVLLVLQMLQCYEARSSQILFTQVCGKRGHNAGFVGAVYVDCPNKPCYLCKQPGHTTATCPHRIAPEHGCVAASSISDHTLFGSVLKRERDGRLVDHCPASLTIDFPLRLRVPEVVS